MIRTEHRTDRGVSIALTHVLTIGITTILIGILLLGASSMLTAETERSTQASLETVGERLVGEIDNVDRIASKDADEVTVTADHPRSISNSQYTIALRDDCSGDDAPRIDDGACLILTSEEVDVAVDVPVDADEDIGNATVRGGTIEIVYDDDGITLEGAH